MRAFKKGSLCIAFGLILTVSAFLLMLYNLTVQIYAARSSDEIFKKIQPISKEAAKETTIYVKNPNVPMPIATVDGYDIIGTLEIPCLNLKLPVMSEWDYKKLRISPCRYIGSLYRNNLIICAHNYKKHFGSLKTLEIGKAVTFTDTNGNVFRYTVSDIETVSQNNPENITKGDWDLTLFTCTAGGTARITVRCVLENGNI